MFAECDLKRRRIVLWSEFADQQGAHILRAHKLLSAVLNEGRCGNFPTYQRVLDTLDDMRAIPYAGMALRLPFYTRRQYYERYLNGLPLGDAVSSMAFHAKWSSTEREAQDYCVKLMGLFHDVYSGDADLIGQDPRLSDTGEERFRLMGPGAAPLYDMTLKAADIIANPGNKLRLSSGNIVLSQEFGRAHAYALLDFADFVRGAPVRSATGLYWSLVSYINENGLAVGKLPKESPGDMVRGGAVRGKTAFQGPGYVALRKMALGE